MRALALAAGLAVLVIASISEVRTYRLPTASMEPTLRRGERVAVVRFGDRVEPDRGDIVAFRTPAAAEVDLGAGGIFLKRIVGLPGEAVRLDGRTWRVPRSSYFVVGDNRRRSCDSRVWGAVPESALIGEVFLTYWPPGRIAFR